MCSARWAAQAESSSRCWGSVGLTPADSSAGQAEIGKEQGLVREGLSNAGFGEFEFWGKGPRFL